MNPDIIQTPLPQMEWPLSVLIPALILLLASWVFSHIKSRGVSSPWRGLIFTIRSAMGFLSLLTAAGIVQHVVTFSTSWRLWPILLMGAILIEAVMAIARLERNIVPAHAGRTLTVLRIATILAVVLMLCQPVFVIDLTRKIQRHVVVLLDVSASMQVPDNNLTASEKLRLAEALYLPTPSRICQLDKTATLLGDLSQDLLAQTDWLNALAESTPDLRARQLKKHSSPQRKALRHVRDKLEQASKELTEAAAVSFLQKEGAKQIANLKRFNEQLDTEATQPIGLAIKRLDDWQASTHCDTAYEFIRNTLRKTAAFLAEADIRLQPLGDALDEAYYHSLPESDRKEIDRVTTLHRNEVALRLLSTRKTSLLGKANAAFTPLLERLNSEYGVRAYTFGAFSTEIRPSDLLSSTGIVTLLPPSPQQLQSTDIAGALEKISTSIRPEQTAGVILLSDGRHNAGASVESIGRKFGMQRIPIFPVVLGGNKVPPTDAAIASVTAPESASTNDRISFTVDLKLDGLTGSNVTVTLLDGLVPVASNTVTPTEATFRQQLLLSDAPKTNGLHAYRVQTGTFPGEVDSSNNVFNIPVLVNSDSVNVLLIEGQPRWEFRFLKNLFMQRDKNVNVQYLLFHPDQIEGMTNRPPRVASVSGEQKESEATQLPANNAEWMKFDVIILGDVGPEELGHDAMNSLRNYVRNRGGSVIMIAGSRYMPHSFSGTPLAEIMPVTFKPSLRPLLNAPEAEFRLSLTAEGLNTVFMKLADDPASNLKAWNDVPDLHWRNGSLVAKNGATVLAYATSPKPEAEGLTARIPGAETLLKLQQYEREHALVVMHQAGLGSVLMFGFDQTWRLRYKRGDQYYHKLWGQILSWATADKIATGSTPLRIGTSHTRYAAGRPVRVMARLATPGFTPLTKATPHATLWSGEQKVSRLRLSYREGSPGIYVGEIASLPEGRYRIELETSGISELGASVPSPVYSDFSVTSGTDLEKVELSADRGMLTGLAGLTAGTVIGPAALDTIAKRLGPAVITHTERHQIDLWNSWPWFLLIMALLTAEWVLRKKVRLP